MQRARLKAFVEKPVHSLILYLGQGLLQKEVGNSEGTIVELHSSTSVNKPAEKQTLFSIVVFFSFRKRHLTGYGYKTILFAISKYVYYRSKLEIYSKSKSVEQYLLLKQPYAILMWGA